MAEVGVSFYTLLRMGEVSQHKSGTRLRFSGRRLGRGVGEVYVSTNICFEANSLPQCEALESGRLLAGDSQRLSRVPVSVCERGGAAAGMLYSLSSSWILTLHSYTTLIALGFSLSYYNYTQGSSKGRKKSYQ